MDKSSGHSTPTAGGGAAVEPSLLEIALPLPVDQTFTYRDPRRGAEVFCLWALRFWYHLVVGGYRGLWWVTRGRPRGGFEGRLNPIEDVLSREALVSAEVLTLCRWAADYYFAPLGEILRGAVPGAGQTTVRRALRLGEKGLAWLVTPGSFEQHANESTAGVGGGAVVAPGSNGVADGSLSLAFVGLDDEDKRLLKRLDASGTLALRVAANTAENKRRVTRLAADGFIEIGDLLSFGRTPRVEQVAFVEDSKSVKRVPRRAKAQLALFNRLVAAGAAGIPRGTLSANEKTALRKLIGLGVAATRTAKPVDRGGNDILEPGLAPPTAVGVAPIVPPILNPEQVKAAEAVTSVMGRGFHAFLLQGITGSGKTEVYLKVIAEAQARRAGALVLVPEIALTPQLASRFRARFGDAVAVLHSGLSDSDRLRAWHRLREGEVTIALGARSAVFAPVRALGVVVVDEEHDGSFKQEEGVRYNGRDLAVVRAQKAGAVVVLGSATPSLESYQNAKTGRYQRLFLTKRAGAAGERPLPTVHVLDLKKHPPGPDGVFSPPLLLALKQTLAAGEQSILFVNRRGYSPSILCEACGEVLRCATCDVSLTYHREAGCLACHYCDKKQPVPSACPKCRAQRLTRLGFGTEKVASVVQALLPEARVARLDRDTAGDGREVPDSAPGHLLPVLEKVRRGDVDILVGTQMVTKGHDFSNVTLVGALAPDQGMNLPDFRASERAFQLLEQVAGRAGRAERPGKVFVQTYCPEHPVMKRLVAHDYEGFAQAELSSRRLWPPACRLLAFRIDGADLAVVTAVATTLARMCQAIISAMSGGDGVGSRAVCWGLPQRQLPASAANTGGKSGSRLASAG